MNEDQESFQSLLNDMDSWIEEPFYNLPKELQARIDCAFIFDWDKLEPDQRRLIAEQWDAQNDPASELRQYWWHHFCRLDEIDVEIREWELAPVHSATDLATQKDRIHALKEEKAQLEREGRERETVYLGPDESSDATMEDIAEEASEDPRTILRQSSYWRNLEKEGQKVIDDFPAWMDSQKYVQKSGNLHQWLVETRGLKTREAELMKKILSDVFGKFIKDQ